MISLTGPDKNGVFILHLGDSENRIDLIFIQTFLEKLDEIQKHHDKKAVVVTAAGKFFCNGLSFDDLAKNPHKLLLEFHELLIRLLSFPVPLIAAINGHAYAGGAMISLACDYRLMNIQKGYICINEIEIGFPLTPGLRGIVRSKVNRSDWNEMVLFAKKFSADEALKSKIIHFALPPNDLLQGAIQLATKVALKCENDFAFGALKQEMYKEEIRLLNEGLGSANKILTSFSKL